jgi:hypothetical protein
VIVKDGIATLLPAYLELAVLTVVVVPLIILCIGTGNSEPAFLDVIGGKYIATNTDPINKYDEIYTKFGAMDV